MVSKLRLCRATQSARASASATVIIASTSTASYSPKIKVDVIGSKPSASPKGFGRSPTIVFPGAVKTFTLSVVFFNPFVPANFVVLSTIGASDCSPRLGLHPLNPLRARCRSREWIGKVLCFPCHFVAPELHDAHG